CRNFRRCRYVGEQEPRRYRSHRSTLHNRSRLEDQRVAAHLRGRALRVAPRQYRRTMYIGSKIRPDHDGAIALPWTPENRGPILQPRTSRTWALPTLTEFALAQPVGPQAHRR